jgi:signal transduction histidine kinase/ActR/RegA family two-component response regulator
LDLDTQQIRAEPHSEIGALLQENVDILVELWSERAVEEQPRAKRVHHHVLHDHLPEFLRKLGRSLAESMEPHNCQHCLPASIHGEQRWDAGWSLPEVVRDFQILRLVVVGFLEESLERSLTHREVLAIGLALDEAIAASVTSYVNDRDLHLRQLESERAEGLKQAQRRLQEHAAALQDADRRKNEFLAMLAHELRNPLAPISHAVEILRLQGPSDGDLGWARELIARQVQHMTRMVDDLLDISRITRGKVELQRDAMDIAAIVHRALEAARPLCKERQQDLIVALPPEPIWVSADAVRMTQVLVNLLNNAAKYTDRGGKIWLTVERADSGVAVKVRDTGAGIPAAVLPHIFHPFVQEDRLQKRDAGGLGIGLALVRSLVDLHGGRVQGFSAGPGQGSEFVVHLPILATAPVRTESAKTNAPPPSQKRRILVVDDHEDAARSLKMLLELNGHEVHAALDGAAALKSAQAHLPDIVLLDIGLPGIDGFEVARRFREDARLKDVLLVALTGYGQDDDRRRSQEAGFNAHLVKPVELETLHAILISLVRPRAGIEQTGCRSL